MFTDFIVMMLLVIQFNSSSSILRMCEIARYSWGPHHTGPMWGPRINLLKLTWMNSCHLQFRIQRTFVFTGQFVRRCRWTCTDKWRHLPGVRRAVRSWSTACTTVEIRRKISQSMKGLKLTTNGLNLFALCTATFPVSCRSRLSPQWAMRGDLNRNWTSPGHSIRDCCVHRPPNGLRPAKRCLRVLDGLDRRGFTNERRGRLVRLVSHFQSDHLGQSNSWTKTLAIDR